MEWGLSEEGRRWLRACLGLYNIKCWCGTVFLALPQFTCWNSVSTIDPGWPSSTSFLFWWQNHSSSCKHLDYAVPCFLSCCSLNLEFTSLHRRRLGTEFGGTKNHMTSVS